MVIDGGAGQVGRLSSRSLLSRSRWSGNLGTGAGSRRGRDRGKVGVNGDRNHWDDSGSGWRLSQVDVGIDRVLGGNRLDRRDLLGDSVVENISLDNNVDLGQGRGDRGARDQQK